MSNNFRSTDRYIPRRNKSEVASFNLRHRRVDSLLDIEFEDEKYCYLEPTFVNTAKKANDILNYRKVVLKALNITHSRVLTCPISARKFIQNDSSYRMSPWPVKPRKKPLIRMPETVLDMPDIDRVDPALYRHVIDWGKQGQIATIFHGEVHLWSCADGQLARTETDKTISDCVKWNRSGNQFAVSRSNSKLSIIDGHCLKIIRTVFCKCLRCTITAIEWSTDNHVITGCSKGSVNVLRGHSAPILHFFRLLDGEIVDLKLSCNNSFLLAGTLEGNVVIFKWPLSWNSSRAMVFKVLEGSFISIKSTAWHPWKESILVVGESDNGVAVWNVNNQKAVDFKTVGPYFKSRSTCILDYLTFNPLSAELLVSFYHENPDPTSVNGCNFFTVFSNLHTRVDEVRYHIGRVPHVLWDGTGTKLATVGTDENLVIWNFFGNIESDTEKILHGFKRKKKIPQNMFDPAFQFGACIR